MTSHELALHEEFLLLGWDDERGRNRYTSNLAMLLGGAAIVELVLDGTLSLTNDRLEVVGGPHGNSALNLVVDEIRGSRKPRTLKTWVRRLGNRRGLKRAVLRELTDRGVLQEERRRLLGVFPTIRYPVTDRVQAEAVRHRVARILTQSHPVDEARDAALGSLVHPAGWRLPSRLVQKGQRRLARRRAKALSKGDEVSADVARAIAEVNTAAMAAIGAAVSSANSGGSGS